MATISCHSNHISYPIATKTILFIPLPIDAICEICYESVSWLQRRFRLKMLTDDGHRRTTDGRRTDDGCLARL